MTSNLYNNFIGIDIGKFNFVVSINQKKETKEFQNNSQGIAEFFEEYADIFNKSLCILETTGGYEMALVYSLCSKKIAVHRANTRQLKSFIRSYGTAAKTDALDAIALAKYGFERNTKLDLFTPQSENFLILFGLIQRRLDIKQMIVSEKNRAKSPSYSMIKASCLTIIDALEKEVSKVQTKINELIESDVALKEKQRILKTIPGIGDVISAELLILIPELGSLSGKAIASLCGVAPMARDSGKYKGYRRTGHGRQGVKPILFVAAMAARNSKSNLKVFYEKLTEKGKKKIVALVALMRKIIVIANAKIKDFILKKHLQMPQ